MGGATDDQRLLDQYVSLRSHDAFAEIVRRHAGFVYACALRKTRDAAMAEDVTQTVFCLLARKAASARRHPLSGWLFSVTRYAAANEVRSAARRRRHERNAARPETTAAARSTVAVELSSVLDDALARLSRADREAVLLRFFDGLDATSLAGALGVSEQAARRRLTRAVERLRNFFAAAGMPLSMAWLDTALGLRAHARAGLAEEVVSAAMAPAPARLLAVRALSRAMHKARAKAALSFLCAALVVSGGAFITRWGVRAQSTKRAAAVTPTSRPRRPGLKLTLGWNGEVYTVPLPPTFPEELRETAAYRDWEAAPDARTFGWATRDGRKYLCYAEVRESGGRSAVFISLVQLFRVDGTLLTETRNDTRGEPQTWDVYASDGKTRQVSLTNCPGGTPGGPFVQTVRFYQSDGTGRLYQADRYGTVYEEWLLDLQGRKVRLLNGGKQNDDASR